MKIRKVFFVFIEFVQKELALKALNASKEKNKRRNFHSERNSALDPRARESICPVSVHLSGGYGKQWKTAKLNSKSLKFLNG